MATDAEEIENLNNKFLNFMLSPEDLKEATEEIFGDLVDEVLMGFVFDEHRRAKCGIAEAEEGIQDDAAFQIVDRPGLDVFGEPMTRKTGKCSCPNCGHVVSANRFATHLERCLGMGRNSSRVASQRISKNAKEMQMSYSGDESDDDSSHRKKRKRKNAKKSKKKGSKSQKSSSDDISTSNSSPDICFN